jgi:glycylpeptide N-tetradecanoyltransferase
MEKRDIPIVTTILNNYLA